MMQEEVLPILASELEQAAAERQTSVHTSTRVSAGLPPSTGSSATIAHGNSGAGKRNGAAAGASKGWAGLAC